MRQFTSPEEKFCARWPNLWSLLNRKAQQTLPTGLSEYISGDLAATGEAHLNGIESLAAELILKLGLKTVGDAYRSDFSGCTSEQKIAEFACELSVCTALARIASGATTLRPPIKGQQKHPDAKVEISGYEVFVEVKRYRDDGPRPEGRSIALSNESIVPTAAKPRMMALASKLKYVPDQLPDGAINILCVFHSGYGENQAYIQQALFGDKAFFDDSAAATIGDNALFAEKAWNNVSAVLYVSATEGALHTHNLWQNPKASVMLPDAVRVVIQNLE